MSKNDILVGMSNTRAGGIQVVAANKDGQTEYWAAAISRPEAVAAVRQQIDPGWVVKLSARRLTQEEVAALKLRPNDVRKLRA